MNFFIKKKGSFFNLFRRIFDSHTTYPRLSNVTGKTRVPLLNPPDAEKTASGAKVLLFLSQFFGSKKVEKRKFQFHHGKHRSGIGGPTLHARKSRRSPVLAGEYTGGVRVYSTRALEMSSLSRFRTNFARVKRPARIGKLAFCGKLAVKRGPNKGFKRGPK